MSPYYFLTAMAVILLACLQPAFSEDKLDTFMHACSGGDEEAVKKMLKEDGGK